MAKRLFLFIFASLVGVVSAPGVLMAADTVEAETPEFHAVETVPEPEPEPEVVTEVAYSAPVAGYEYVAPVPLVINYTVTTWIGSEAEYVATAQSLSESDIYKFQKLVYAHNRPHLMQSATGLVQGDKITITEGAMAQTYVVADSVYYNLVNGTLNGDGSLMRRVAYGALGHDLALMTCYGEGRWVVLLDSI